MRLQLVHNRNNNAATEVAAKHAPGTFLAATGARMQDTWPRNGLGTTQTKLPAEFAVLRRQALVKRRSELAARCELLVARSAQALFETPRSATLSVPHRLRTLHPRMVHKTYAPVTAMQSRVAG